MAGLPILDWNKLITAINQFKIDLVGSSKKIDYKYTWDNFKISVNPKIPTVITSLPEGNQYTVIINNKSSNSVYLYLGADGDERLTPDNSAWEVRPGCGMIIESSGCVLWGISDKLSDIIVTIHSTKPNSEKEVAIALNVELKVGTGTLLGKDIPLSELASIYSNWENILRNTVDSNQGITGNKLAYLKSFQPNQSYEFNLVIDPTFADFNSAKQNPIEVFLIDFNLLQGAATAAVAASFNQSSGTIAQVIPRMIGFAKHDGWVKNLPPTGGVFTITPGNAQSFLHFSAHTSTSTEGCVITNFDKATNTFTLGGY